MKSFTPDLITMGQSHDDRVLDEQARLWEIAGARYVAYLDSVRPFFPPGLRQLDERYYLHDSVVRGMGRQGNAFVIILQLDTPPQSILTFTYELIEDPIIIKDAMPSPASGINSVVDWQYDEIELVQGESSTWRQSILLSNGWELTIHFWDVQIQEICAVLPATRSPNGANVSFVMQH